MVSLDDILLADDHPRIVEEEAKLHQRWQASLKNDAVLSQYARVQQKTPWYLAAQAAYSKYGLLWQEPSRMGKENRHVGRSGLAPEREDSNVWFATLPTREKCSLLAMEMLYPAKTAEEMVRGVVLTRSLTRLLREKPRSGLVSCVLPNAKIWLDHKQRYLMPEEKVALQGFFAGQCSTSCVAATTLSSLGGNAVGVPVTIAINFALLASFGDLL